MSSSKKKSSRNTILLNVYNSGIILPDFFESLKKQTFQEFSILAVDDGSVDNTISIIHDYDKYFDMKILPLSHVGLRKARSIGVQHVNCDILFILDSDLILEPNAIEELIKPLGNDPKIAAVGGILKNAERGLITESYGELRKLFINLRTTKNDEVDWVNGGFCAIRKKVIDEIGGYAQHETSEDLDISWRIREKGYKLYLASKATAYHRDPITFGGIWMRECNIGKREYFLAKQHTSYALSFKRILRFYPIILPIMLIIFFIFFWPIIPIILFLSFIPPLILLKSRLLTRITAWLTFNIMNFAYCTGFILSFLEKK